MAAVLNWDSGLNWDAGLTWDAGDSPNPGDPSPYLALVTSEHNQKPNYMAMLAQFLQPIADGIAVTNALVTMFDVDTAAGVYLDQIGLWVGANRNLTVPITGVFFTFDSGPGFNIGILAGDFTPETEVLVLPDTQYRLLIKAKIAANHYDGTLVGAYAAYNLLFGPLGYTTQITDYQDMSMDLTIIGPTPDALTQALFEGGYFTIKPDGVRVRNYYINP